MTVALASPSSRVGHRAGTRGGGGHVLRPGTGAAHLPRPVHGRAQLPGPGGRVPLRAGSRHPVAPVLPALHDRRRNRPAARVLVLGAGVAGLQAIGTAKRLGARVSANDIRPASADEVASMGGTFIRLDLETAEASGGYARELSSDRGTRQREVLAPHVAQADVLITTAAIRAGGPAPGEPARWCRACGPDPSSSTSPQSPAGTWKAWFPARTSRCPPATAGPCDPCGAEGPGVRDGMSSVGQRVAH